MQKQFKVWPKSKSKGKENSPPHKALSLGFVFGILGWVFFCLGVCFFVCFYSHWFCEAKWSVNVSVSHIWNKLLRVSVEIARYEITQLYDNRRLKIGSSIIRLDSRHQKTRSCQSEFYMEIFPEIKMNTFPLACWGTLALALILLLVFPYVEIRK